MNDPLRQDASVKLNNIVVVIALCLLVLYCVVVPSSFAQQLGSVITFQEQVTTDEEGGALFFPSFVFTDPVTKEIYLIDGKSRVIIFTSDFFPLYTIGKKDGIVSPQGLTIDDKGNLYIAQAASNIDARHRISVYNACFKWERDIYLEGFEGSDTFVPYRIAVDKAGRIYVAASYFPGVLLLDKNGKFLEIISPEEDQRKAAITNVVIDETGKIYLVSEEEGRIYIYDENRKYIMKFGEKGGSSGKLSRPRGIGVDANSGRMYVVDFMRHTITVYNKSGKFIFEFGGLGWGEGWFQHPIDIDVDREGRITVADTFNQRVQVFNSW